MEFLSIKKNKSLMKDILMTGLMALGTIIVGLCFVVMMASCTQKMKNEVAQQVVNVTEKVADSALDQIPVVGSVVDGIQSVYPDDNAIEESVEETIESLTGCDVDLTPCSPEV